MSNFMNEEISREALLIYLNDLRTMEMIRYESNKQLQRIETKKTDMKTEIEQELNKLPRSKKPDEPNRPKEYKENGLGVLFSISSIVSFILFLFL